MAIQEKEISRFALSISLIQDNDGKIIPKFFNRNSKMPIDIIISQLKLFTRTLEDDYYPEFRNNMTTINFGPDK